jgi:formylglycine-generating enzyme required for sulfatase activity
MIFYFGVFALCTGCSNSSTSYTTTAQNTSTQFTPTIVITPSITSTAVPKATLTVITPVEDTPTLSTAILGDTWIRPNDRMTMIYVPSGSFQMGSTNEQIDEAFQSCAGQSRCFRFIFTIESPAHTVTLDEFWIDQTEVTNAQFVAFLNANGNQIEHGKTWVKTISEDSESRIIQYGDIFQTQEGYADHPIHMVSWYGASAYCEWVGGQLPTEAQWEYAARGPDGWIYPWGNNLPTPQLLNYNHNVGGLVPVGSYPDGSSWVGALDMAGNADEWVNDWFDQRNGEIVHDDDYSIYYSISPTENPTGPETGTFKVLRGSGSAHSAHEVRTTFRAFAIPYDHLLGAGFRCVVTASSALEQ